MPDGERDPWLLTPGPLTTSATVKAAMLRDWGSRDSRFIAINRRVRERLVEIAGGEESHVCVPLQGSGTFAVEAMLGSFVPRQGKLLILVNGAYGKRMVRMMGYLGRAFATVAAAGRRLLIDAMSAFGALPLDARLVPFDAVAASSNKCFEGVPGIGFVIARREALAAAEGNAHSLSLDLHDQWQAMEKNAQWRFTPPTHVLVAFDQALAEHRAEGGVAGRGQRYRANCKLLVDGMRALGFETLLPNQLQAPIIVTFRMPADPRFVFERFYDRLSEQGYVIYPGKLTVADSFRIGCIGRLGEAEMKGALDAIRRTLAELGVASGAPAGRAAIA